MGWDDAFGAETAGVEQPVELVGAHLRLTGTIRLGRFGRLTDFVNASRGFIRVHDVRLLLANGDPTDMAMTELMVDQDEISFFAQEGAPAPEPGSAGGFVESSYEASGAARKPRAFVMFTPGHSISGKVHVFGHMDAAGFVDASDPHFIPVTEAAVRSLDDGHVSTYQFVLINRDQMIGASEVAHAGDNTEDAPGGDPAWPEEDLARQAATTPGDEVAQP